MATLQILRRWSNSRFQHERSLYRHSSVRYRSWKTLSECKYWLIILHFPQYPPCSRQEMIDSYVETLANTVGSVEEAKKKIYALNTTIYTGFQANIDEATSKKIKEQPRVSWVLPDGWGDPENGIFAGDRYDNGVITPDTRRVKPVMSFERKFDMLNLQDD